ncbi:hypothetical protein TNCV_4673911 [Trichonephila clavipes]|nr:hypothetical protein TNCV_4673911 [Trichonephila clavipes]
MEVDSFNVGGCVQDESKSSILEDLEFTDVAGGCTPPDGRGIRNDWKEILKNCFGFGGIDGNSPQFQPFFKFREVFLKIYLNVLRSVGLADDRRIVGEKAYFDHWRDGGFYFNLECSAVEVVS